jgi:hypothetical protein
MEEGLLENTLLIFEGKKSKGDYHQSGFSKMVSGTVIAQSFKKMSDCNGSLSIPYGWKRFNM